MKWKLLPVLAAVLLAGCAQKPALETVNDVWTEPVAAPVMGQVQVIWPEDAAQTTMYEADGLQICVGEDYELRCETVAGGDLNRTLKAITGFDRESLTVLSTTDAGVKRYESAWCTESEQGTLVGRTVILDDGAYHYTLSALVPQEQANGKNEGFATLESFRLIDPGYIGS